MPSPTKWTRSYGNVFWAKEAYDGNGHDEDTIIDDFTEVYSCYLVRSPTKFEIDDISGAELLKANTAAGHSAGGLDGWSTEDMTLMTPKAAQALADLFNAIEKGVRWPKIMWQTKAAFLANDAASKGDCMKYRVLTLLPLFYRRWAGLRQLALSQWIQSWSADEIHAGTSSNGADDAWWRTSLEHELARLEGKEITGGSADIYKCFDQTQNTNS